MDMETGNYSKTACKGYLYFECGDMEVLSAGVVLDLDVWAAQREAWWASWADDWDETGQEADDLENQEEPVEEAAFIPAAEETVADSSYRPPDEPAFQLEPTDAPPALLEPIRDMLEGFLARDWTRLARAWPDYDKSPEERARELAERHLGDEFGRWVYARQVDDWWAEGRQACVIVRGLGHCIPDGDDPAVNEETVLSIALRKADRGWRIWTLNQGWPACGSADSFDGPKPWLDGWDIGTP
jgi:hypothetical protein